jgi:hypothetical protein
MIDAVGYITDQYQIHGIYRYIYSSIDMPKLIYNTETDLKLIWRHTPVRFANIASSYIIIVAKQI